MKRANLLLGMPASGKSTFIAALGHILLTQDVDAMLRLEVSDDESYIIDLQRRWLKYEELKHTPTGGETWVTFHLISNLDGLTLDVELPDFSGESLKSAAVTGIYPEALFESLRDSAGIFLFTNADAKQDDVLLNDLFGLMPATESAPLIFSAGIDVEGDSDSPKGNGDKKRNVNFEPMDMPEEPKIVQLLQAISSFELRKRKLVIMISAWDVVLSSGSNIAPADWLAANRPMIWQYLNYNPSIWDVRIYGVSAQGGRYPQDTASLKTKRPSERVKLIGHDTSPHDLTAPLSWMAS